MMCAILVVDGHQEFRHAARVILQRNGYETMCAVDADHALKKLREHLCAAAVVGPSLTDTTGLALLRRIRCTFPRLPVMLVTEHPSPEAASAYQGVGAQAYLAKAEFLHNGSDAVRSAVDTYGGADACMSSSPAVGE